MRNEKQLPALSLPEDWGQRRRDALKWNEQIDDTGRVASVLTALAGHQAEGTVTRGQNSQRISLVDFNTDSGSLTLDVGASILSAPFEIALQGAGAVYRFNVKRGEQRGSQFVAEIPAALTQSRQRWNRRCTPVGTVRLSFRHPKTGAIVRGTIHDVSHTGLAVDCDLPTELSPGSKLAGLRVERPGQEAVALNCEVRYTRTEDVEDHERLGLRIAHPMLDYLRWSNVVEDLLYPGTKCSPEYAGKVWDLFGQCGYFLLAGRTMESFKRLEKAYHSVNRILENAPQLYKQTVWVNKSDDQVIGSATILKVYSGTWLGYHMAKLPGKAPDGTDGREILRELNFRSFEHMQRDPELEWCHGTVRQDASWTRYAYYEFTDRMHSDEVFMVPFTAMELYAEKPVVAANGAFEASEATEAEKALLLQNLEQTRPLAYRAAIDLEKKSLDLAKNKRLWRGQRLERDREIFVSRKDGVPQAAAVVEMVPDGIHVFQLLNLVRLYPLFEGGEASYADLLEEVRNWFDEFEKERFVVYLEDSTFMEDELAEQCINLGRADMLFCSAERVPELLENIYQIAAPKLNGR